MSTLALKKLVKSFGPTEVIKSIDLEVDHGDFVVFVGPSGCGKSTLLRMIAGLEAPTDGAIEIDGRDVTGMLPPDRGVAMVFQSYALYPHMTVEENIGFGLKIQHMPREKRREKVLEAARILQLEHLLRRKPKALSGGQRQRVAIGRAIVKSPRIFLFDEPLSNLDAELRVQMRLEIARLHQDLGATMIYVTHDQVEAMTLADKIVVLRDGRLEQAGPPVELYANPDNLFVAGFIGSPKMNFVEATVDAIIDGIARLSAPSFGPHPLTARLRGTDARAGQQVMVGFRPECSTVNQEAGSPGIVKVVEQLGNLSYLYITMQSGAEVTVEQPRLTEVRPGQPVGVALENDQLLVFAKEGQRL
ncbi:ABC transporter ATP-binding protein [Consotaella aegiceratis]|uniref:ABC transporter ATP-binding protein n=1 Tax=Consotaella aegiceratis TaxID=3097961 RepID=UPI002F42CBF8